MRSVRHDGVCAGDGAAQCTVCCRSKSSRVCVSLSNTKSACEGKVVILRNSLCMRAVNRRARSRCVTEQEAGVSPCKKPMCHRARGRCVTEHEANASLSKRPVPH